MINIVRRTSKDQKWRLHATKVLLGCAKSGKSGVGLDTCVEELSELQGPEDGLIDAHVMAAYFIHEKSSKVAKEILNGIETDAAAAIYYNMGDQSEVESISSDIFRNLIK